MGMSVPIWPYGWAIGEWVHAGRSSLLCSQQIWNCFVSLGSSFKSCSFYRLPAFLSVLFSLFSDLQIYRTPGRGVITNTCHLSAFPSQNAGDWPWYHLYAKNGLYHRACLFSTAETEMLWWETNHRGCFWDTKRKTHCVDLRLISFCDLQYICELLFTFLRSWAWIIILLSHPPQRKSYWTINPADRKMERYPCAGLGNIMAGIFFIPGNSRTRKPGWPACFSLTKNGQEYPTHPHLKLICVRNQSCIS